MEAKEIRIGNFITSKSASSHWEVMPSDIETIFLNENHYLPIPLTEEWLLKFGFIELDYAGGCFYKDDINIDTADFNCCYKKDWLEIDVKYIHQLQNLYFALTNKELTVKNETENLQDM